MKSFVRNNLFGFLIGIILCSGIVYGVNLYKSEDISYTPSDTSWDVSNVNEALNDLYLKTNDSNNKNSKQITLLGTGSGNGINFNVSSFQGYEEFTVDNFIVEIISNFITGYSWLSDSKKEANTSSPVIKVYDETNGIIKITTGLSLTTGVTNAWVASSSITVKVWLIY